MKWTPSGRCGATASITARLTEPTSVTVAPGFRNGAISRATSPIAPTGTQSITRSAPSTASAAVVADLGEAEGGGLGAGRRGAGVAGDAGRLPVRRSAWLIEDAISPRPIRATCGVGHQARTPMNSRDRIDHPRRRRSASPTVMRSAAGRL